MINHSTYSLEDVTTSFDGHTVNPVICNACKQALQRDRKGRSNPRSYAALAQDSNTYRVLDWNGLGTTACRCCSSTSYGERWVAEPVRKRS